MRQFFTLRFWATLLALAGLAALLVTVFRGDDPVTGVGAAPTTPTHRIDLVHWLFSTEAAEGFAIVDGVTTADLALVIDGTRTMVVKAGTPGEIDCPTLTTIATCTVAADLLGDAVLWFSVVPGPPGATVQLPAVMEILDGGWVRLDNGWIVQHAEKVERKCDEETASLTAFINTYGDEATSTFSIERQELVRVTCR